MEHPDDMDDGVDIDYKHKGAHYKQYSDDKKLVADSRNELNTYLEEIDDKIMNKIHENELAYRQVVMKYLRDKENELKVVLRRLSDKNLKGDAKD